MLSTRLQPEAPVPQQTSQCASCGAELAGGYCHQCGEKLRSAHDLSVRHFAHEAWHELFHVDGKIVRTVRLLVTRPGLLTAEYFTGRRTPYIGPLRLYLVAFAIVFFLFTLYRPASPWTVDTMLQSSGGAKVYQRLDRVAARKGTTRADLAAQIEERWHRNISLLQLADPLLFGLALAAVQFRRRRYLAEHLVFALHFTAFNLMLSMALFPIWAFTGITIGPTLITVAIASHLVQAVYLYQALRRYYAQPAPPTAYKTAALVVINYLMTVLIYMAAFIPALLMTVQ